LQVPRRCESNYIPSCLFFQVFPLEPTSLQNKSCFSYIDSSVAFRPTQRTKMSTTTRPTQISTDMTPKLSTDLTTSLSTNICDEAPNILGFDGPFKSIDDVLVDDGSSVYYECVDGKVADVYINRRTVRLPCANVTRFRSPKKWPKCKRPTHCIGPAKKPGDIHQHLE
jgi:hypothetical protein